MKPKLLPESLADQVMGILTRIIAPVPDADRDLLLRGMIQCAQGLLAARRELRKARATDGQSVLRKGKA